MEPEDALSEFIRKVCGKSKKVKKERQVCDKDATKQEKNLKKVDKKKKVQKKKVIKKRTPIKGKKHVQTKATEIPKKVKEAVWERDHHKCIFCGKEVDVFYANAHFIPRSAGGLGIKENILTACEDCHREFDNGKNTKKYKQKAERHLRHIYGKKWTIEKLIYKKNGGNKNEIKRCSKA